MEDENAPALQEIKPIDPFPDAGTALCAHIKKQGFQSHLFSDITLAFHGKDYALHKIILSQSHYFHSLLSGPWKENGKARIELQIDDPMVTTEGLESAFAFMYGMTPIFTADNVVSILAAGCFLGLENLCANSVQFALSDLKVDTFVRYNNLAEKHCYGKFAGCVRSACWSLLCTHASRELLHHLPKLSLEVLCHLLKSDELWVLNEAERYKLAKQALIDWKLARAESVGLLDDFVPRKRGKSLCARKSSGSGQVSRNSRTRSAPKGNSSISKGRSSKKKEGIALHPEPSSASDIGKEGEDLDLKRLRRLWEEDAGQQLDGYKGGFEFCTELFTAGGIIFAHLEVNDILQVKKELEDANLSSDVANDSIWHHVLLKDHILKLKRIPSADNSSSDTDEEDDDDMLEDEEDEDEDEDDEDLSERDTSDSDRWSTDNGDDSNSSDGRDRESSSRNPKKVPNSSLVCFSPLDVDNVDDLDPKRRKTTGGFTWSAKPDIGMRLVNFPPFRFGAEFVMKDKTWTPCLDSKSREVFYGGSTWNIGIVSADRHKCIRCQLWVHEKGAYKDTRKEVIYKAKLFTKTISGLRCVAGVGVRSSHRLAKRIVSMLIARDDVLEDEPLRISAVVQLVDDEVM